MLDIALYNLAGALVLEQKQVESLDIRTVPAGAYLLYDADGNSTKLVIEKK